jgi:hypothetical protein
LEKKDEVRACKIPRRTRQASTVTGRLGRDDRLGRIIRASKAAVRQLRAMQTRAATSVFLGIQEASGPLTMVVARWNSTSQADRRKTQDARRKTQDRRGGQKKNQRWGRGSDEAQRCEQQSSKPARNNGREDAGRDVKADPTWLYGARGRTE